MAPCPWFSNILKSNRPAREASAGRTKIESIEQNVGEDIWLYGRDDNIRREALAQLYLHTMCIFRQLVLWWWYVTCRTWDKWICLENFDQNTSSEIVYRRRRCKEILKGIMKIYREVLGWTELTFVKNINWIFYFSCSEFCNLCLICKSRVGYLATFHCTLKKPCSGIRWVPDGNHKVYFPITQTFAYTIFVLWMSSWRNSII